ncbi:hypothetical protein LK996_14425 [Lysobacter sp. A6]|uniref:Restriction endonuclease n=1 Tax=Noviluteimonas lactosilytica TaxID=2888523 RepID=A0ABS8JKX6_9GAMM|nr:hypothetical protein [Lysobacter lactosilyticus]
MKAACQLVSGTSDLDPNLRRRARRVAARMDGVGPLRHGDGSSRLSRLTKDYGRALPLARLVLQGGGVTTQLGALAGRSFLIRTPELIEEGLRNILDRALSVRVRKRRLSLGDSGMTINPDLVFGDAIAVGDIKYRHVHGEWHRPSLYQVVAFATGFGSERCAILGFSSNGKKAPPDVVLGNVEARCFAWDASPDMPAVTSEQRLVAEVNAWLSTAKQRAAMAA